MSARTILHKAIYSTERGHPKFILECANHTIEPLIADEHRYAQIEPDVARVVKEICDYYETSSNEPFNEKQLWEKVLLTIQHMVGDHVAPDRSGRIFCTDRNMNVFGGQGQERQFFS